MKLNIGQKIAAYYFAIITLGTLSLLCDPHGEILNQRQKPNPASLDGQFSMNYSIECERDVTQTLVEEHDIKGNYCLYLADKPEGDK